MGEKWIWLVNQIVCSNIKMRQIWMCFLHNVDNFA